jgi:tetratricopeptide (TPR) repeat protein
MSEHELWNELGNLYFLSGSYDQAVNAYRRSIQLDSSFGRPYSNLALTYVQQGKFDEAIDLYRHSIELLTEDKEKAVSWNRLGTVYRHLKDYSRAVIAFQEADELDAQNAAEFVPAPELSSLPMEVPSSVLGETAATTKDPEPKVEWWDVGENAVQAAPQVDTVAIPVDEPSQSWTPADTSQYQEDLSQMPETGSLTTWGETDFGDEFEVFSPLEPDIDLPDQQNDVSTWLPIPEEEPWNADELRVPPFLEEIELEPPDPQPDRDNSGPYQVIQSVGYGPPLPAGTSAIATVAVGECTQAASYLQRSAQQTYEQQDVDIDLQERPASEFALPQRELSQPIETQTVVQPPPASAPALDSPSPSETPVLEREEEELREIEMGIAKFKRVVQINPRNAHAWDALGTLYKSAGLYKDAILAYQQAISNDSSRSLYYHHLGLVYACEGRDEDAIGAFQQVIELDPEYSLAHATLGGYYRKMGLEELAQKHIGKAMKNIFDSENEYNRACLEAICGNADQAIKLLGVALKNKQTYVDWILRDPDLDFIRQDPRFKQLISDYTR